jgi:tetratricopeptide (TPR) repeat protein
MLTTVDPSLAAYFAQDEAVERLVQALALAEGFHFQIVLCNSQYVSRALVTELERRVASLRGELVRSRHVDVFEGLSEERIRHGDHIGRLLEALTEPRSDPSKPQLVFVDGTASLAVEEPVWQPLFERLNQRRDVIAKCTGVPLTLIVPERIVGLLGTSAPDLWSFRSVQVVIAPPTSAQSAMMVTTASVTEVTSRGSDPGTSDAPAIDSADLTEARMAAQATPEDLPTLRLLSIRLEQAAKSAEAAGKLTAARRLLEEAVAVARRGVALTQDAHHSTQEHLDAFPSLAFGLTHLGNIQSALGQREAALQSSQEAADIYRKLAQARPDTFLPDFAMSLNNLGVIQSALGQREAALQSSQEATDIRSKLAHTRPDAFLPALAMSLNNLGEIQSALGQHDAALQSTQKAADIYRKLVQSRPDAFLPDFATSLNNLGNTQSALGQREAALQSSQEAADIFRKLAQTRPEAFLPALAVSLNNLGNTRSALGQREAALQSSQEAADIFRKLAQARPDAFLPDFATSLNNLGNRQSALGQHEAALQSTQEAADIRRKLAQVDAHRNP